MKTDNVSDFHYSSKSGTDFIIRPFYDAKGAYAGHDYLLAQIYGGSYASTQAKPLYAVQVSMFPLDGVLSAIAPGVLDYTLALGAAASQGLYNNLKTTVPGTVAGVSRPNYIDIHQSSPAQDNQETTHSTSWGLSVGAELGTTPSAPIAASYNQSKTWTVHDMQVYRHEFDPSSGGTGVCWNLIFTRKDGLNLSSFSPRLDALFQCSKDKLRSGRFNFVLVERLIYWGQWNEHIVYTLGESTGTAAALGAAPLGPVGAAFGAVIGAIAGAVAGTPAISTKDKNDHNQLVDNANKGDSMALHLISDMAHGAKQSSTQVVIFSLDFDKKEITTVVQFSL